MAEDLSKIGFYDIVKATRTNYVHILKPRTYHEGKADAGKPYFEVTFLLPEGSPECLEALNVAANVARAHFPGRDFATMKFPFEKGDVLFAKDAKKYAWAQGMRLLTTRSPARPALAVVLNGAMKKIDRDDDAEVSANNRYFYSGTEALGRLNFKEYEGMGGGVKAYLNQFVSLNRGDKLSGGADIAEVFGGYIGLESNIDPTAGQGNKGLDGLI
jgi:Protein of unknown function (DUF2815)